MVKNTMVKIFTFWIHHFVLFPPPSPQNQINKFAPYGALCLFGPTHPPIRILCKIPSYSSHVVALHMLICNILDRKVFVPHEGGRGGSHNSSVFVLIVIVKRKRVTRSSIFFDPKFRILIFNGKLKSLESSFFDLI